MPWSDFEKLKFLGKGSYGKVYAVRRRSDNRDYALKEVNIKFMTHREREDAVNEIRLLASVSHPNIIAYHESFIEADKLCIVTEFCSNGDLFALLRRYAAKRRRLSEERIWSYFIQVCHALRVLHNQNILHRDIKSPNVFIGEDGRIKLGDLGVAKLVKNTMAHTQIGTPYYLSPEIWKSEPYDDRSDVWSLGCLLYEMATLRHPFEGASQKALSQKVLRGKYAPVPDCYTPDLIDVIARCLQVNPRARPTVEDILAMPAVLARMDLVAHHANIALDGTKCAVMDTIKVPRRARGFEELTEALPKPVYMRSSPAKMQRYVPASRPPEAQAFAAPPAHRAAEFLPSAAPALAAAPARPPAYQRLVAAPPPDDTTSLAAAPAAVAATAAAAAAAAVECVRLPLLHNAGAAGGGAPAVVPARKGWARVAALGGGKENAAAGLRHPGLAAAGLPAAGPHAALKPLQPPYAVAGAPPMLPLRAAFAAPARPRYYVR